MDSFSSLEKAIDAANRSCDDCKVKVPVTMKKVYEYENQTDTEVEIVSKVTKGLFTRESDKKSEKSAHSFGASLNVGFPIQMVQLEVSANYTYNKEFYHEVMTEKELQSGEEITTRWKVPPKSKLIRWQLVATLENEIIGFGKFIDTSEDLTKQMKDSVLEGTAVIQLPRKIIYGETQFRIRHKGTNKYLIPALMEDNWDSLTLQADSNYYFQLEKFAKGVRIRATNCTHPEWCYAYSNEDPGQIFLNKFLGDDLTQLWIINRAGDIRDGDVVTFRSRKWETANLCHSDKGKRTNVFCLFNKEDEWILEI